MTDIERVRAGLKKLFKNNIDPSMFPVQRGDKINIGSYSIAKTDNGYSVKSYVSNSIIASTFTKTAAVAIAKSLTKKNNALHKILTLDKVIEKNAMDCLFYAHTMKVTKNPLKYESTAYRYDISKELEKNARAKLNKFIL